MTLDPQARSYLDRMLELGLRASEELPVAEARKQAEDGAPVLFGPKENVAAVADVDVDGVPVRLYTPAAADGERLVVYFHGGGWVIGSLDTHDGSCRALANRSGCRVVSVGYRLAPEHRFPAAVEDCWKVTRWAFDQGAAVAVAGDSAGGNLAAVVSVRARDGGLPLVGQALVYPVVVCEFDPLRDEGVAYAERLREAGVPVRLSEYEGMIHGFIRMQAMIDRSQDLLHELGRFLAGTLSRAGC